jgi:hypothetical protein
MRDVFSSEVDVETPIKFLFWALANQTNADDLEKEVTKITCT